tara:strand:- start:7217 stop:7507 length:291 start_codon:yes stop_codon:yes gene_type:complete
MDIYLLLDSSSPPSPNKPVQSIERQDSPQTRNVERIPYDVALERFVSCLDAAPAVSLQHETIIGEALAEFDIARSAYEHHFLSSQSKARSYSATPL